MAMRSCLVVSLALLASGCMPGGEPLLPELKGKWAAPNAAKLRYALAAERYANPPAPAASGDCRNGYVVFEKHAVTVYANGQINPVLMVQNVKRDGTRVIIDGGAPMVAGGKKLQIELVLRHDGDIRFDDIVDERGRSMRYDRFENAQAHRAGITTVGDVFALVLDLKPCRA
ncbi:MAG: hypothetical protein QOC56_658 [Alphaproteobacteria bacterium]|jgi:hypothetical protein|nr:hypothetical protein [Alphaproteobacteria bacterium]